ncbi:SIMPL domain-containing protein [Candidatus Nitronereus thalassa]|uniref:SIMPL domain-containing protein n=1 Tax=Candidatus Nitronereus thalassa TaxID=3020898 RepID=A0ABU3KC90_9BACT|nr:SIMPL domain-containing protein [Candidatus Nitronereus thalassa]MDT7043892.1 SIMPL domain-containing protein [Candidatus Nitronereus thalassa]
MKLPATILMVMMSVPFAWGNDAHVDPSILNVSARGTIQLAPDTAIVNFSVETAGESFEQVVSDNRDRMERVMAALIALGIPEERIQTTSFDITPQYAPPPRRRSDEPIKYEPPKILGYTARNGLKAEVRDLVKVGAVADRALKAGANHFNGIQWIVRDQHPVYLQALAQAAKKAKEKAKILAQSLDVQLVGLLTVQEGGISVPELRRSYAKASMLMADGGAESSVPMSPGEIKVEAQVTLLYKIGPTQGMTDVP